MSDASWIADRLPPVEEIPRRSEPDFYGASWLIARQLGRKTAPRSFSTWTHAWHVEPTTHVLQVLGVGDERIHLVATEAHADLLGSAGRTHVVPVGLPYIYADHVQAERRLGSLLVMPAHTLHWADYDWDQDTYVDSIAALSPHFSCIVACIQANCVESGYWTTAFEKRGIPWIAGASSVDANALVRMTTILKSFEFMTTNRIASHVPYAAYSGCKVSVFGTYIEPRTQHYTNHPFYKEHPDVLALNIHRSSEVEVRRNYPQFFAHPAKAADQRRWACQQLGEQHRREPAELARLLGWTPARQAFGYLGLAADYSRRRVASMYRSVKKRLVGRSDDRKAA